MSKAASNPSSSRQKSASENAIDPMVLWVAFRRHWAWVVPCGLALAAIAAFVVQSQFVPVYKATHVLEANKDYVLERTAVADSTRDLARSERILINHGTVLKPILENNKLRAAPSLSVAKPEKSLRDRIEIGNAGTSNLLTISYTDADPGYAKDICNAIVEHYLRIRNENDGRRLEDIEQWLQQPISIWKRNVENLRQELSELTKEAQGYDPFKEGSSLESNSAQLGVLRGRLAELGAEEEVTLARMAALDAESAELEKAGPGEIDPVLLRAFVQNDTNVQAAKQEIAEIQGMSRSLELRPTGVFVDQRQATLKSKLKDAQKKLTEAMTAAEKAGRVELAGTLQQRSVLDFAAQKKTLEMDLVNIRAKRDALQQDYDKEKARIEGLQGETAEIFFAREEYQRAADILGRLNERLAVLNTEQGRGGSIRSKAPALRPSFPIEQVPWKKIGMASVGAFLLPFALAVLLEFRYKRLTTAEAVEATKIGPVMGEIAKIPGGASVGRRHQLFEESIDALRANLLFQIEQVRTIVVTSAMPSEGKSSVASQLAISLAKATGETVLLIDADLRSPDQHDLLGLDVEPGLVKLLSDRCSMDEAIDKSLGDLVHVIPAGRLDANPHHLLTKTTMHDLFEELKEQYQYIMVDTAPVLPAAESLAVTAAADATLLCAMRDVSRTDHVQRTHRRLEAAGSNVIGTVFSGVPSREYAYRYGNYRYRVQSQAS